MTKIAFVAYWDEPSGLARRFALQAPGGAWGDLVPCDDVDDADYVVVFHSPLKSCPECKAKAKLEFLFCPQCGTALEHHKWLKDKKVIYFQAEPVKSADLVPKGAIFAGLYENMFHAATWHVLGPDDSYGAFSKPPDGKQGRAPRTFEFFKTLIPPRRLNEPSLSAVVSRKQDLQEQKRRRATVAAFAHKHPDKIDVYGRSLKPLRLYSWKGAIKDKYCALYGYQYSLAFEKTSLRNYFTEKLIDCFLCWTKPIYWGCPNLSDFFPPESYTWVDMLNPEWAADQILEAIDQPVDYDAIREARDLVLSKYNVWACIERAISEETVGDQQWAKK